MKCFIMAQITNSLTVAGHIRAEQLAFVYKIKEKI